VTSLDVVPWFLNFSKGEEPESDSWMVQCEIILTRMLGAVPQDEDFPPDDPDDVDPNNFQFSFGQPSQGPPPPNGPNGPFRQFKADLGNPAWAPWDNPNAAQQLGQGQPAAQQCIQPNLEEAPPLIPLQPMNGNDNDQPHDAANDGLALPVEEVIQNNQ